MTQPEDMEKGWKPDPENATQLRFWDGTAWTDRVHSLEPKEPIDTPKAAANIESQPSAPAAVSGPKFKAPTDRTAAWKIDPGNPRNYRYWNGVAWTNEVSPRKKKKGMPASVRWALGIVGVIVVIAAIASGGDEESDDPSPDQSPEVTAPESFEKRLQDAVLESVEEEGKPPTFGCTGPTCEVEYTRGETLGVLLSAQEEFLEEQRRIWKTMFSRKQTRVATIRIRGPITTVGGKTRTEQVMITTCTRAAANQIDWNSIDVEGIETLCDQNELVNF